MLHEAREVQPVSARPAARTRVEGWLSRRTAPVSSRITATIKGSLRRRPVRRLRRDLRLAGRRGVFADTVGVLGFDDAGTAALLVATSRPVGAAVSVAARRESSNRSPRTRPALVEAAPDLQAPWLGSVRRGRSRTPADHVDALRDAAARAAVATTGRQLFRTAAPRRPSAASSPGSADHDDPASAARRCPDPNLRLVRQPPAVTSNKHLLRERRAN